MEINKKLYDVLFGVVAGKTLVSPKFKSVTIKIRSIKNEFLRAYGSTNTKEINHMTVLELYTMLELNTVKRDDETVVPKVSLYDEQKGKYLSFVLMLLRNLIIDEHSWYDDKVLYDGETYNTNCGKTTEYVCIDNLPQKGVRIDNKINSDSIIELFKEFYSDYDDVVDAIVVGNKLVSDYTMQEAIFSTGRGKEYGSIIKKFRRSEKAFEEFLLSKGVEVIHREDGFYFYHK